MSTQAQLADLRLSADIRYRLDTLMAVRTNDEATKSLEGFLNELPHEKQVEAANYCIHQAEERLAALREILGRWTS